ncbi:ABC transporter permease [Bacillus spongiae]|uniref:ABC transporter permease n=1 Tax=Bacillus spongiae TaxID=2683610 RepID=A0ABU8HIY7_9BACI
MLWTFIRKELLLFIRNPRELFVLLVLPFLLITILGLALGGLTKSNGITIEGKLAIIENGMEQKELEDWKNSLSKTEFPGEVQQELSQAAKTLLPITTLKEEVLGDEKFQEYFKVESHDIDELAELKADKSYSAIIEVPEDYTFQMLNSMLLNEEETPTLLLHVNEGKSLSSNIIEGVLKDFQKQYTLITNLGKANLIDENFSQAINVNTTVQSVEERETVSSLSYYTVGMSVMFVLYIASNISSFSYQEKRMHVFDRILLANVSKWTYMLSIMFAGMILTFLQLSILFGLSAVIYNVTWPNWVNLFVIMVALSFAVGGIAVLLASINYRMNSETFSSFFSTVLVTIFAFLGGSFVPITNISNLLSRMGSFTPNGAGMVALLQTLQGYSLAEVGQPIWTMTIFGAVMIVIAVFSFPKRGGV